MIVDNNVHSDAMVETVEPRSERLFGLLRDSIIRGELPPGVAMTEPELAKRFGVSRAPLREALRRLEEQQLLERSPYRGMRVAQLSSRRVEELYEIREELEALACRRAAGRLTDPDLVQLKEALADERASIHARTTARPGAIPPTRVLGLHEVTARIADNRELLRILDSAIWRLLRADYWRGVREPAVLRASHVEHVSIVRALAQHDSTLSELLMRRHIRNTMLRRKL